MSYNNKKNGKIKLHGYSRENKTELETAPAYVFARVMFSSIGRHKHYRNYTHRRIFPNAKIPQLLILMNIVEYFSLFL